MRVLSIGDLHEPATHPGYLPFCRDTRSKYKTTETVFAGDVVDWHAVSFWPKEPNCPGSKDEYTLAKKFVNKWNKAFNKAKVCIGNHDERPERLAKSVGIPSLCLKSYAELWDTPKWKWDYEFLIDDVLYYHGTGTGGVHPAWNQISCKGNVVIGHNHARAGVKWMSTPTHRLFGMDTGCGINITAFQFVYGKHLKYRPMLGCGVILDGLPLWIPMPCGIKEKYHKSRF